MWHAIELALILLLLAVAQGVIDMTPRAPRRVAGNFLSWIVAFAVGAALLSFADLSAVVVLVGIVLLGAYIVRWIVGGIVESFRGPFLFVTPSRADLADAAHHVTGLPVKELRRVARRITRRHEPTVALLGLISLEARDGMTAADLETAWDPAADQALQRVVGLIEKIAGAGDRKWPTTNDILLMAQALCLYEQESVLRCLAGRPAKLGSRAQRAKGIELLERGARRRKDAERFGWAEPAKDDRHPGGEENVLFTRAAFWPAVGIRRAGFGRRATALTISEALLLGYGVMALYLGRGSGWIFLGVGILIHIQALFAVGDFRWLAAQRRDTPPGRGA